MTATDALRPLSAGPEGSRSFPPINFQNPPKSSWVQRCYIERQVGDGARAFPGLSGARLWQPADGELTAWQQSGEIPLGNKSIAEKVSADHVTAGTEEGSRWLCPLRRNDEILGILEVCGGGTLSDDLLS